MEQAYSYRAGFRAGPTVPGRDPPPEKMPPREPPPPKPGREIPPAPDERPDEPIKELPPDMLPAA